MGGRGCAGVWARRGDEGRGGGGRCWASAPSMILNSCQMPGEAACGAQAGGGGGEAQGGGGRRQEFEPRELGDGQGGRRGLGGNQCRTF
jgi:hypothetical protein